MGKGEDMMYAGWCVGGPRHGQYVKEEHETLTVLLGEDVLAV